MAEIQKPTIYYEYFDFPAIVAHINEQELAISETTFVDDAKENEQIQLGHIVALVQAANMKLVESGFMKADVILGAGKLMPEIPMWVVDKEGQSTDVVDKAIDEDSEFVTGRYKGVWIMRENFGDGAELSRLQLMHRAQILHAEISTAYVEQMTNLYAYLPLDNPNIEIFSPVATSPPTQKALEAMLSGLVEDEVGPHFPNYEAAFQRVLNANIKKIPLLTNMDWLFDKLEVATSMKERSIKIATNGFLIQSGTTILYRSSRHVLEGVFLGFSGMSTYQVQQLSDGSETAVEYQDDRQLALCIEIMNDGKKALAKVPINSIIDIPQEYTD